MSKIEIPIFFACDDNFVKFTIVSLHSLLQNASRDFNYRVYVLHTNISEATQQQVLALQEPGVTISFENVTPYLDSIVSKLPIRDYYSKTTYFRLFIAEMFPHYNKAIYIGEEGVHYQIKDGGYWPIQPAFGEKLNADKFVAFPVIAEMHEQWMARARKTDTIGASFAQINEGVENFDVRYVYEGFANGIPAVYENQTAIDTSVGDELIKLIVEGGDVAARIDEIREEAKSDYYFDDMQEAMNEWYTEFASVYDWSIVK